MMWMAEGLEIIAGKEYVGRLMVIGSDVSGNNDVVIYAITGRSESSRARDIVAEKDIIRTDVTDDAQLKKGNPKLLIYNCIRRFHDSLIVSNGAQTDIIYDRMQDMRGRSAAAGPMDVLVQAFARPYIVEGNNPEEFIDLTKYEPDAPNHTPRISGVLTGQGAAMCIIKCEHGKRVAQFFEVPLVPGVGYCLTTYSGSNVPPGERIPSFCGEPVELGLDGRTAKDLSLDMWHALGPKEAQAGVVSPGSDFRVGVATVFYDRNAGRMMTYTITRAYK